MNKYPLDRKGVESIARDFLEHDSAQTATINELSFYLATSLHWLRDADQYENAEWIDKAKKLLKDLGERRTAFDTLRFDQSNGHKLSEVSPYKAMDIATEGKLNSLEDKFGPPMTEEEIARHFGEPMPLPEKKKTALSCMTIDEIHEWEAKQNNSNDIYKISARVKNIARAGAGANLTPVGEMLTNTYVHVLKSLYDFADTLEDKNVKIKLTELIRTHEGMPGTFIAATVAGVGK